MLNLSPLLKLFNQLSTYTNLVAALKAGSVSDELRRPLGVLTAARPALLAALFREVGRPLVVVTARTDRARVLAEQIQAWVEEPAQIYRLPDPDALPHEKVAWGNETIQGRLAALSALALYRQGKQAAPAGVPAPVIVTSARALMHKTLPLADFTLMQFRVGQQINLNEMVAEWVGLGYQPEEVVETVGSFSRRGGILDIFPPTSVMPVRIELFGDEIDSLRSFDPVTQRSEARLDTFIIGPATEALPRYGDRVAAQLSDFDITGLQPSTRLTFEEDMVRLENGVNFRGIEYYLPFFYSANSHSPGPALVLDYLSPEALVVVEDVDDLALIVDELETQARAFKQDLTNVGDLPAGWPNPYLGWAELSAALAACHPLILGSTQFHALAAPPAGATDQVAGAGTDETGSNPSPNPPAFQSIFIPAPAFGGQVKNVIEEILERKEKGDRVVMVSRQSARLSNLLDEHAGLVVSPLEGLPPGSEPPPAGSVTLVQGVLVEGWMLRPDAYEHDRAMLTVMTDAELFGWKKPTPARRGKPRQGITPETFFADVNPGDLVVHIEHGIGRYVGLAKLNFEGVEREYLEVQYANNDKLYVPIHQADRLARYVGLDEAAPVLNRLGGADWNTVKRKAKKAVEDIAKELLEIYAKREVVPGRAFSPDTEWQAEIEEAFPFVETEDQLRAIVDVKADMEQAKPMDRLICGDVGYGKTEVALRAAFKAVMDGVQVAVLAPTTVLAHQHYQTFLQRLAAYPVKIEMLSRFRTPAQQQETLKNLAEGNTDIVIGTHRLLQKDVAFKELGLLIIDEEQRFGVKHKEKLKAMRTNVDVLTLTATPIPRTLHMSLSGVRDLSTINTPPEERLPIQTTIAEYDEVLIRNAILRELDRGGQIFFVYNRVMGIEQMANRIRKLVPEARVEVAHGQMSERHLEKVMIDFMAGEFDVLVTTTIIENGLDMPNVNTIIIDRADRMGLSQLYQLRGRVGRGAVRAYAYLLIPKDFRLNREAHKRLEAIAEATELGAGFRIALRDLEIRGAGELLGSRQHGQIAAVGFDLYTRLLGQAIRELKGEAPHLVTGEAGDAYLNPLAEGIQLNLPISAYVPESYLPEEKLRLRLYRRLANITTLAGIDEMAKELEDRFGEMPGPVANLLYQLKLKVLAMEAGVKAILTEVGQIIIRADSLQDIDRDGLQRRLSPAAKVTPRQVSLPLHPNPTVWQAELEKTLRLMGRMLQDPAGS